MKISLGIDAGGSTTKIVGVSNGELTGTLKAEAEDRETSIYGAIGKFLRLHHLKLGDIEQIYLTGVGSSLVSYDIFDIPTRKINEFQAIGRGGLKVSGLSEAIIASIGTGTAIVRADANGERHLGGSGVGGGTILGLSSLLINEKNISEIVLLAKKGELGNVDLLMKHITDAKTNSLPQDATAANFGNLKSSPSREDLAIGIISMVMQTVGMLTVFACSNDSIKDIVITGATAVLPQCSEIMEQIGKMCGVRYHIPENTVFATAIGATLC